MSNTRLIASPKTAPVFRSVNDASSSTPVVRAGDILLSFLEWTEVDDVGNHSNRVTTVHILHNPDLLSVAAV